MRALRVGFTRRVFFSTAPVPNGRQIIDLTQLSENQLREECTEAGVSMEGSRDELVRRILEASTAAEDVTRMRATQLPVSAWEYDYEDEETNPMHNLRTELEEYGLPTEGTREDLIARLALFHEETDIVDEGWFEFFSKLSQEKVAEELQRRALSLEGNQQQRVARLAEQVEAEERREVSALIRENYTLDELRQELLTSGMSTDGTKEELVERMALKLDDLEREEIKDIDASDDSRTAARAEAVERRQTQRLLDENIDPGKTARIAEAEVADDNFRNLPDLMAARTERIEAQPMHPEMIPLPKERMPNAIQLDLTSEELILKEGFSDYSTALAAYCKHCLEPEGALGQEWIDTSVTLGGNFMRTKDLPMGRFHWSDSHFKHGIISIKISSRSLGSVKSYDRSIPNEEVIQTNVMMLDLNARTLSSLQIRAAEGEVEPEHGHEFYTYHLSSNWVTAFKKVKWPENYDNDDVHTYLPLNDGIIIEAVVSQYPMHLAPLKD